MHEKWCCPVAAFAFEGWLCEHSLAWAHVVLFLWCTSGLEYTWPRHGAVQGVFQLREEGAASNVGGIYSPQPATPSPPKCKVEIWFLDRWEFFFFRRAPLAPTLHEGGGGRGRRVFLIGENIIRLQYSTPGCGSRARAKL